MFSGIVEEVGRIKTREPFRLEIEACKSLEGTQVGESIAVNGTCLTVTDIKDGSFSVDVTPETLRRTNLGLLAEGDAINLERSLSLGQRMGGHMVQGHIDGTGEVVSIVPEGDSLLVTIKAPDSIMRFVVEKGFIAIDGVSFTIVSHDASSFVISLIPYTRDNTVMGYRETGDVVNLEIDIMAKYVERFLESSHSKVKAIDKL